MNPTRHRHSRPALAVLAALAGIAGGLYAGDAAPASAPAPADAPVPEPVVESGWTIMSCGDGIFGNGALVRAVVERANRRQPGLNLSVNSVAHVDINNEPAIGRALAVPPKLVLLHPGTATLRANGALATADYPARLSALIQPFLAAGTRVVVFTPFPWPERFGLDPEAEFVNERVLPWWAAATYHVADEHRLPVFDLLVAAPSLEAAAWERDPTFAWRDADGAFTAAARDRLADALSAFLLTGPGEQEEALAAAHDIRALAQGFGAEAVILAGTEPDLVTESPKTGVEAIKRWSWDRRLTPGVVNHVRQQFTPGRWKGPADASGLAYAGWSADRLCLGFVITDDSLMVENSSRDDGVRIFLDLRPLADRSVAAGPGCLRFSLTPGGTNGGAARLWVEWPSSREDVARFSEGAGARWFETDKGYTLEVSLPWRSLNAVVQAAGAAAFEPGHGADLGFTWVLRDRDGDDAADAKPRQAGWTGGGDPWLDASNIGRLVLTDPKRSQDAVVAALSAPGDARRALAEDLDDAEDYAEDDSGLAAVEPGTVELRVTANGWLVNGAAAATAEELTERLREATRTSGTSTPIRMRIEPNTPFPWTLGALDVLTKLGLTRVVMAP